MCLLLNNLQFTFHSNGHSSSGTATDNNFLSQHLKTTTLIEDKLLAENSSTVAEMAVGHQLNPILPDSQFAEQQIPPVSAHNHI